MAPLQDTDIQSLVGRLREAVGADRWRVWFEGATDFHVNDGGLTVGVANLFISDYLKSHFADRLAEAVTGTFGRDLPVTYLVQSDLFRRRRAQNLADEAEAMERLGQAAPPSPAPARGCSTRSR